MNLPRRPVAALVCAALALPSPLSALPGAAPENGKKPRAEYRLPELQGDARILHTLNRFTFGPRPGDVDAVRRMGLENWFEQQLNPAAMDETTLNARLEQYPAMQLGVQELLYRYPSNGMIHQAANGKIAVPQEPVLRAIYQDQMDRVAARKAAKADKDTAQKNATAQMYAPVTARAENAQPAMMGSTGGEANTMAVADAAPVVSDADVNSLLGLTPEARVQQLASLPQPQLDATLKAMRPVQRLALIAGMTAQQRETVLALEGPERLVAEELIAARLTRDIYASAQLNEVMTDFWLNHFNIYLRKNEAMPYALVSYERDVIRPRALGKFEDLLEAVAHSPAMLLYLDNATSMGPESLAADRARRVAARRPELGKKLREGLNENYARELMELHTVGVNGGYTQADVTEVARILTGWTVDRAEQAATFEFNDNRHEPGTKTVMGVKYREDGEREGEALLHALASSPKTAQFLSRKLAVRFVSDDPPQALVDRMAQAYMTSGGDIRTVLRTMFHAPEFWATDVYRAKVKTPLEYLVSAMRASNADIESLRPLANALREQGMPLYGCVPPTGYDWRAETWVSTAALVDRMNFALQLAANKLPGVWTEWSGEEDTSTATMLAANTPTPEAEESRLEATLLAGGVSESTRAAVLRQFEQQYTNEAQVRAIAAPGRRAAALTATEKQDQVLAGLLLGSPEFQRR